jgi:hypothetical protein
VGEAAASLHFVARMLQKKLKRVRDHLSKPLELLERKTGFGPATPTLARTKDGISSYILVYLVSIFMTYINVLCSIMRPPFSIKIPSDIMSSEYIWSTKEDI